MKNTLQWALGICLAAFGTWVFALSGKVDKSQVDIAGMQAVQKDMADDIKEIREDVKTLLERR